MAKMRAIPVKDGRGSLENLYIGETAMPTLKSRVLVKACIIAELRASVSPHHPRPNHVKLRRLD